MTGRYWIVSVPVMVGWTMQTNWYVPAGNPFADEVVRLRGGPDDRKAVEEHLASVLGWWDPRLPGPARGLGLSVSSRAAAIAMAYESSIRRPAHPQA